MTDPEFEEVSLERARGESVLLLGRTTYEMMSSAWPSDEAQEHQPQMADVMAKSPRSFKNGLVWLTYHRA
jgi:dihydrofolate reductase